MGLADKLLEKPITRASPVQGEVAARRADGRIVRNIPRQVQSLSPFGAAPFTQGSLFGWLLPRMPPTPRLLPPAGEEAVRRSLTDGRGICKALGTVVYFPTATPDPKRHTAPCTGTLSRLTATAYGPQPQSAYSPLPWSVLASARHCGSLTPSALCALRTRFPTSPTYGRSLLLGLPTFVCHPNTR